MLLDEHDVYSLTKTVVSLMTERDTNFTKKENRLQQICFENLWHDLMDIDHIATITSKNMEFERE